MSVGNCLVTDSGRLLDLLDPQPEQITEADIAQGLARAQRFSGQTMIPLSVDRHSLHVAAIAAGEGYTQPSVQAFCLLHDASEAYICDLPTPVKLLLPDYRQMERRLQRAIFKKFDLLYTWAKFEQVLTRWDRMALCMEAYENMSEAALQQFQRCGGYNQAWADEAKSHWRRFNARSYTDHLCIALHGHQIATRVMGVAS